MDTPPLWLSHTLIAAVSFTAGVALASLWWRRRCARLAAGEAQRRRDRRERIERLTASAEAGGGKTRDRAATVGDVLAHVHRTGHAPPVDAGGRPLPPIPPPGQPEPSGGRPPTPPPIEPDPRLDNYVLEGGKLKPPQKRRITIKWVDPRTGYW